MLLAGTASRSVTDAARLDVSGSRFQSDADAEVLLASSRFRRGVPQGSTLCHEIEVARCLEEHECGGSVHTFPRRVVARMRRQFRAERSLQEQGIRDLDPSMQDPRAVLQYDELVSRLDFERNLRDLSKEQREVAQLLADGFSQVEISSILGVSQQAISRRVKRLRRALKKPASAGCRRSGVPAVR